VNASMLSTGAHAAITEYAMAEQRNYTCETLDASTCSSVAGCEYHGCSGPSSCSSATDRARANRIPTATGLGATRAPDTA
jgi:hypothetical protein